MRILKILGLGLAGLVMVGAALFGVRYWRALEVRTDGLAVGASAPDFALTSQTGETVRLGEMLAEGPVAVLFYRSADW